MAPSSRITDVSKISSDISTIFKPRPPLRHFKPTDYPVHRRRTNPNITGISKYINSHLLSYVKEYSTTTTTNSEVTENNEVVLGNKIAQENKEALDKWNPHEDPNIKDTDPYRTIFVGRLPYDIDELQLQKHFLKFGQIEKIRIVRDKFNNNKSKGYGFIVFHDPISSKMACKEIGVHRGLEINGRICIVDIERSRTVKYFRPRRLGGGLGGRGYNQRDIFTSASSLSSVRSRNYPEVRHRPVAGEGRYRGSGFTDEYQNKMPGSHGRFNPSFPQSSRYNSTIPLPSYEDGTSATEKVTATIGYKSRTSRTKEKVSKKPEIPDY
ncbi:U1 snRNP complex subunit SNP1 NDAI_0E04860 [Naumovozyma dairenensis CBS 421]|uniref:RRM domain-containing protein n=1 Tax=Naumovozyma dairenensis (strain ATCC 10597 / BCRC 20456 / CBS 421 / NBRC 0211 / NRRL Y-12639) TaxID=1071378 RepID=G0WAN0_NAUDC|nr:hypothetical protein NDAI_0E04860 [Naumovozyma dairenensis CBS 421]CCD25303.1 hypothetical protein NDAI_0E04860 [Naumovozyma dairenensis CBS 421]